jgi:hypothetical protein
MTVTQVAEVYRVPVEAMPGISEGLKPFRLLQFHRASRRSLSMPATVRTQIYPAKHRATQ